MSKNKTDVPRPVVSRMVNYLAHAEELSRQRIEWISSSDIGEALGLTSATMRRDLLHMEFRGVTSRGYAVNDLVEVLSEFLGIDREWRVAIVGAGNLGQALALHAEWGRRRFAIQAVFDIDGRKVGKKVGGLEVLPMDKVTEVVRSKGITIGVLAVPATAAQRVADLMIAAGVSGIFNLALTHIVAPAHVCVTDGRLVANMIELAHNVSRIDNRRESDVKD